MVHMSTIHVRALLEALDRPSTLRALVRKTGYPFHRVFTTITEARAIGAVISAHMREGESTFFTLEAKNEKE